MAGYKLVDLIEVRIWDMRVGVLAPDPASGYFAFEYDPTFRKAGIELSPLLLPVSLGGVTVSSELPEATYSRLPAFIADALPDRFGNALIDAWMARQGFSAWQFTVLDRLAYMGSRAMGALEFEPAIRQEQPHPSALEARGIVEAARKALTLDAESLAAGADAALLQLMQVGTSAGGAKAKAVIGYNSKTEKLVSGQFSLPSGFEPWLLKISTGDKPFGCIEYAYYLMARDCGIDMMESRLLDVGGVKHFMTRRFDRTAQGAKIHLQTLCAMAAMDFNQLGTYDYLQVFSCMERLGLGFAASDQMFARMVFNVCMANNDDHAKNHSFLLEKGGSWELAPAYDMMYACNPANKWTYRHALGVNGAYTQISREDVLSVADRFHIKAAREQIEKTVTVAGNWMSYAVEAGVDERTAQEIGAQIDACAKLLLTGENPT